MNTLTEKYCATCGNTIHINAEICPKCGVRQPGYQNNIFDPEKNGQQNRWLVTLLLCWFLGVLGVHRFYTGHTAIGVVQLLTLGGCGIWMLIDLILIITGNFKDAQGNPIKNA